MPHRLNKVLLATFIGVTSKDMEEGIEKQLAIYDRYIESAQGVLSESQAEEFEALIKGMKEMTTMAAQNAPSL